MKMKILTNEVPGGDVDTVTIEIGQLFQGKIGTISGTFLKTYDEIVLLDDPQKVWRIWPDVSNYRPVKSATLSVEV